MKKGRLTFVNGAFVAVESATAAAKRVRGVAGDVSAAAAAPAPLQGAVEKPKRQRRPPPPPTTTPIINGNARDVEPTPPERNAWPRVSASAEAVGATMNMTAGAALLAHVSTYQTPPPIPHALPSHTPPAPSRRPSASGLFSLLAAIEFIEAG
jgi:hypothetical protein